MAIIKVQYDIHRVTADRTQYVNLMGFPQLFEESGSPT